MAIDKFLYLFIFFPWNRHAHSSARNSFTEKSWTSSSFQFWRENGNKRNKKTEEKTRENTTGYIFRICVASSRRIQAFKVLFHYFSYNLYKNKSSFVAIEPDIAYFCNWFEKRNCSKLLLPFIARREYLKLSKDTILFDALV